MPEYSNYLESLDPVVGALSGDEIIGASKDGDAVSLTAQQIADLGGGGVTDGDKGDVVVSSSGTVWTVDAASESQAGKIEIATQAETNTGTDDARAVTPAKLQGKVVGVQDFPIPASAFWPRVTAGCSPLSQTEIATSLINLQSLDFNQTTQQYAQTHFKFPRKYNLGTITFSVEWTAVTGTGSVVWSLAGAALADGDALTTALGTAVNVTDAAATANTFRNSATSGAVTLSNTPADADGIFIEISRVTGNASDDMAADAKFLGIVIHVTADAAIDQ